MTALTHLETLQTKHSELEVQIKQELRHPVPDSLRVARLKKEKLHIKDMILQADRKRA